MHETTLTHKSLATYFHVFIGMLFYFIFMWFRSFFFVLCVFRGCWFFVLLLIFFLFDFLFGVSSFAECMKRKKHRKDIDLMWCCRTQCREKKVKTRIRMCTRGDRTKIWRNDINYLYEVGVCECAAHSPYDIWIWILVCG